MSVTKALLPECICGQLDESPQIQELIRWRRLVSFMV